MVLTYHIVISVINQRSIQGVKFLFLIHPTLLLHSKCIPENVCIIQKIKNQCDIPIINKGLAQKNAANQQRVWN